MYILSHHKRLRRESHDTLHNIKTHRILGYCFHLQELSRRGQPLPKVEKQPMNAQFRDVDDDIPDSSIIIEGELKVNFLLVKLNAVWRARFNALNKCIVIFHPPHCHWRWTISIFFI